jgi:SAM-dependent methyltransferase
MIDARALLPDFLRAYPFQPATAVWRSVEVAALLKHGVPLGRGLDVGCGDGLLTSIIVRHLEGARSWIGIDPDSVEVELARQTGIYQECLTTTGATMDFAPASFDFALSNSVLEHIPELDPVIAAVSRVLKPGGRFILTVPSDSFHAALRGPLLPGADRSSYLTEIDRRCAHIHYWSQERWRATLDAAGLSLVSAVPYLDRAETQLWETCARFTSGLLYKLFGRRQQPIQIQRKLGMRRHGVRLPQPLAWAGAHLLRGALDRSTGGPHACLLIEAIRR